VRSDRCAQTSPPHSFRIDLSISRRYHAVLCLAKDEWSRSYQYVSERTPRSAVIGVPLVAALPVGTIVLVAWALLATTSGLIPEVTVLPVRIDTVFFALLLVFAGGIATFGLSLLRDEQTRVLGGSLLLFGVTWALPLAAVTLLGVYPPWLNDIVVVSVATTMIASGYCFPPLATEN
jgi:hypothetical protein